MTMDRVARTRNIARWLAPYPMAVQSVVVLALLAAPLSALGQGLAPWQLWTLAALCGGHLLAAILVPARWLPLWAQILYLLVQVALTATAQALAPAPLLDYVYLAIVLQAMALFRPWLWIPLAVAVYAVWSGLLFTSGVLAWLQANLALAFPATCAIIAAIVYLRQQRRSEQAQELLLQVQQRYEALATGMAEQLQQRAMLEERSRLAQTVVSEVQLALSRAEQSAAAALAQAQTNLARLQSTVAQTRASAANAVERLRNTVAALRLSEDEPEGERRSPAQGLSIAIGPSDEAVIGPTPNKVLTWVLPSVFVALALGLTLSNRLLAWEALLAVLLCSALLFAFYVLTQLTRHPVLLQLGLSGQILVVVAMTALTHTLPLLLGLLLVLWQLAMRLPLRQIIIYLAGAPAAAAMLLGVWRPLTIDLSTLLAGGIAAVAVSAPLLAARRQLERRKQNELQVALLSAEIEQQTAEVQTLAVAAERSRLAREVHDELGSRLVLINLQLQLAEELAAEDAATALEQLQRSREQLHEAWRGVLAVADAELPLQDQPLSAALRQLAAPVGSMRVELQLDGELDELPEPVAATVYRAVQEGLTNARKHASASLVSVHATANSGYATVTVTNDCCRGAEAAPAATSASGSYGLLGLRERVEAVGGGLEAGPSADGGWRLRVVLPAEWA
jgi:signal transduction histidine kinase